MKDKVSEKVLCLACELTDNNNDVSDDEDSSDSFCFDFLLPGFFKSIVSVKVEPDTDRLKHHRVFSIANIQDKAQRRKQGVQMHQRKLWIADHMIWVETTILQGPSQQQY